MPTARLMQDQGVLDETGGRLQPVDTADAHGAAVGRALQRFGAASFEVVGEFAERDAQRDVDEGDAEFQRRSREIMLGRQADPSDPEDEGRIGFLSMEGNDATSNRDRIEQDLRALRDEIAGRRRSRRAQETFTGVADRRLEQNLTDADRHVLAQTRILEDAARESLAQEHYNSAVSNYLDRDRAAADINAGIDIVLEQADADGASMQRTEAMVRDFQSRSWAAVIIRRADQDPEGAAALFEERRGLMNAEDAARTEEATRAVFLADRARSTTDRLLAEHGNDYSAALAAAENIASTTERDEVVARILQQGTARETAEARATDDAEERARTAIHRGGFGSVRAEDRARLQREGRWNSMVGEFEARQGGGAEATRAQARNMANMLLLMSDESAPQFHIVLDAMRGIRTPGVSDEMIAQASGGMSRSQLVQMRNSIVGVEADSFRSLVQRQEEMRGQRPIGQGNDTITMRIANRLAEMGEPIAAARGMDTRRPGLAQVLAGQGNRQMTRNAEWRGFLLEEARRHVQEHGGREPNAAEMDAIIARSLARGSGGRFAFEARAPEGAFNNVRVQVPFASIDVDNQRALHQAYRRTNNLGPLRMEDIPEGAARRYTQIWREANPGVDANPGTPARAELEMFIREGWTDDPARTSALRDRREWMENRYADQLQRY